MDDVSFNQDFIEFLGNATSPFHAVKVMAQQLTAAGFVQLNDIEAWPGVAGRYFSIRNDSSLVAFVHGTEAGPLEGMRMIGAHTDSPCLMVKPKPEKHHKSYQQLVVEVYGGALLNPWFDRDLSLAGRVSFTDDSGTLRKQLVDFKRPLAVIPSLAIHLDREANSSRSINAQTDILPLLGCGDEIDFRALLATELAAAMQRENLDVSVKAVLDYELGFYDVQPAALLGLDNELLAGARLDNLLSCYAGLRGLLASDGRHSSLLICTDHEEVGSQSAAGASGPLLLSVLQRLAATATDYAMLVERSFMISADNAHAVHPNFSARHDDNHGPLLNAGPVIKSNANQRYATNSETAALFRQLCASVDVPVQSFTVRNDMGCGSTIGPITATAIGVRTLDVGVPQLAMHSPRELTGSKDPCRLAQVLSAYVNWGEALAAAPAAG
ncbi:M18 family aminopeptidase [Halieaceae bacterium IMCC14734]|uniref:M18 family aminopeptidase n=1 Tax=Candidatus Litorirhabdus singularis TaxID=2518993 RepID=A0ABT3TJ62_9GAMM|nr:M18 family aminopeptidase [Candidatus Litorirhabdus singularis]MCX2981830.1 M18 family aminopeptidase [Candidatus Litorirhabdus singularis]